jgi:hypothetical protein
LLTVDKNDSPCPVSYELLDKDQPKLTTNEKKPLLNQFKHNIRGPRVKGGFLPLSERVLDVTRLNSQHNKLLEKGLLV